MRVNYSRGKGWAIAGLFLLTGQVTATLSAPACHVPFDPGVYGSQFLRAQSLTDFNGPRYIHAVRDALDGKVMGYSLSLRNGRGEEAIIINHGLARTPCETVGEQGFTAGTVTAWGSVSKVISAVALLHGIWQFEQSTGPPGSGIGGSPRVGVGPQIGLETPFWPFLPQRWRAGVAAGFHSISFSQLLQHKAGFAPTDASFLVRLRTGPAPTIGKRAYSNALGEIIQHLPHFFDPYTSWLAEARFSGMSDRDYQAAMTDLSWRIYQGYVQKELLEPIGVTAGCNDLQNQRDNYALFYAGVADRTLGHSLHLEDRASCGARGWAMSTRDMSWFLHHLTAEETFFPRRFYEQMANRSAVDDRLGWASVSSMAGGYAFHSNGIMDFSDGSALRTLVIHYPNGYVAAIASNSKPADPARSLAQILLDAYEAARGLD